MLERPALFISSLLFAVVLISAPSVWAQAGDGNALGAEAALLEGNSETPTPETADKDPDPKMAKLVETERKTTEKRLNELQTSAQKFADIEEGVNRASQYMLKAMNDFFNHHGSSLDAYRMAASAGDSKKAKKLAKKITKIRKNFLKALKKSNKMLDKLKKLETKLAKRAAKEEAEDQKDEKSDGEEAQPDEAK